MAKVRNLVCCLGLFSLLGCLAPAIAAGDVSDEGGLPPAGSTQIEGQPTPSFTPLGQLQGLATPAWGGEDRRVVGNLHALAVAFKLAGKWAPSPSSVGEFERTPEYLAASLWDPYGRGVALLVEVAPDDWSGMAPGTYFSWEEEGYRYFAGATREGPVVVRSRLHAAGWDGGVATAAPDSAEDLAFCRLVSDFMLATSPQVTKAGIGPARTMADLSDYWWLWDSRAMLENSHFTKGDISLHWLGGDLFGAADCRLAGESVWADSPVESERALLAQLAALPPLEFTP